MKPFDLKAAVNGEKVVTRNGTPVAEFRFFDSVYETYPVVASVDGEIKTYTKSGEFSEFNEHPLDLFMAETDKSIITKWSILTDSDSITRLYDTKEEAHAKVNDVMRLVGYKIVKIEWEEE